MSLVALKELTALKSDASIKDLNFRAAHGLPVDGLLWQGEITKPTVFAPEHGDQTVSNRASPQDEFQRQMNDNIDRVISGDQPLSENLIRPAPTILSGEEFICSRPATPPLRSDMEVQLLSAIFSEWINKARKRLVVPSLIELELQNMVMQGRITHKEMLEVVEAAQRAYDRGPAADDEQKRPLTPADRMTVTFPSADVSGMYNGTQGPAKVPPASLAD